MKKFQYSLLGLLLLSFFSNAAQQQQWASQYVKWQFEKTPSSVWNIDQDVWLIKSGDKSFWPIQWSWKNGNGIGGYLGLQQESNNLQRVRFSLWNASEAEANPVNGNARPFGGEGIGYTCELPFKINENHSYRYRLWRLDADATGQWWGAWIIETDANGKEKEHLVGKIKVDKKHNQIELNSISNFVEFYGKKLNHCIDVPSSTIAFSPPRVNHQGNGKYESSATFRESTKAKGNLCSTGNEGIGAIIKSFQFPVSYGTGALMVMGMPKKLK